MELIYVSSLFFRGYGFRRYILSNKGFGKVIGLVGGVGWLGRVFMEIILGVDISVLVGFRFGGSFR